MNSLVSKNIFWLTVSRVAAMFMLLFAYTKVYPYLGPFGAGQYQFIQSYVLLFAIVVDFGIQQFITKKISERPDKAAEYFIQFFSFEIVVSTCLYIVLIVLAKLLSSDSVVFFGICLAGLGMVASALTYPYLSIMSARQDLRKVAWVNFINSCVNFGMMLATVMLHRYVVFLASVTLVFGILDLVIYRFFLRKYLPNFSVFKALDFFNFSLVKSILKQGWPFALLVGFSAVYNRIDTVIITFLKGYEQTGLYTVAYRFFDLLGFFPSVVSFTLFPYFAGLMAKNALGEIRLTLEKYLRLMIVIALPIAFGGSILSQQLIGLITHNDSRFISSGPVLAILIWAPAILFVYIPINSLVISQLTKKALAITGINVIINIVGNLLFVPHFGIKAAAIMTVVSEGLQGIFYFYFVRKNIVNFSFASFVYKPAFCAALMGAALWPLRAQSLLISLPIGAGLYFVLLMLTGFLNKEDFSLIKNLMQPSNP